MRCHDCYAMECPKCHGEDVEPENRQRTKWYCYDCKTFFEGHERDGSACGTDIPIEECM